MTILDPLADPEEVGHEYGLHIQQTVPKGPFDAVVLAVRHDEFVELGAKKIRKLLVSGGLLYDIKEVMPVADSDARI